MINPKNICICSLVGFLLSFFIGLFSDVRFAHVFLRAFCFALVFGALCVGITFLYQKFLSIDNGSFSAESDASGAKTSGSVVNIVVDDSALPDDGMAPNFTILNNRTDLTAEKPEVKEEGLSDKDDSEESAAPDSSGESLSEPSASETAFKPVSLASASSKNDEPVAEPSAPQSRVMDEASASTESSSVEKLDELPDVGSISMDSVDGSSSPVYEDEIVSDSEFASGGSSMKEQPISGATTVMAKAIQTLLAKDNS